MKSKSMSTPEKAAVSRAMEMLFAEKERLYIDCICQLNNGSFQS